MSGDGAWEYGKMCHHNCRLEVVLEQAIMHGDAADEMMMQ